HGQRRFAQMLEDARHVVGDGAHDEAVEQRHMAARAGTGEDAAGRQEAEILHRRIETVGPAGEVLLGLGERLGDASPAVLERAVERRLVGTFEPIFHVPDLLGDGRDGGHCSRWMMLWQGAERAGSVGARRRTGQEMFLFRFTHMGIAANPGNAGPAGTYPRLSAVSDAGLSPLSSSSSRLVAPSTACSSLAWKAARPRPGAIGGRISRVMVPGRRRNERRGQNKPELSATGTTGTPVCR